jgi:hypothetical protein
MVDWPAQLNSGLAAAILPYQNLYVIGSHPLTGTRLNATTHGITLLEGFSYVLRQVELD